MYPDGKKKYFEATVEEFSKHSQDTALNLEHNTLLISILVENLLPDMRKQTEDNIVGWLGQPFEIIQVAIQFFEELKTIVLLLQNKALQEQNCSSGNNLPF